MATPATVPAFTCDEGLVAGDAAVVLIGGDYVHVRTDAAGRVVLWRTEPTGIEPVLALGEPGDAPGRIASWLHALAFAVSSLEIQRQRREHHL